MQIRPVRAFGIQIHPFVSEADLDLVAQTKAQYCRCDMGMDISLDETDLIYNGLLKRNIQPIFITSIMSAPDVANGFTDYIYAHLALGARYPMAWWEICNEVNIHQFWPTPDPLKYAELVRLLVPPLRKKLAASSKIISTGTSGIPIDFMRAYLSAGVSQLVDCVGFHPYGQTPDTLPSSVAAMQSLTDKPLFATEYGSPGANTALNLTQMATACGNLGIPIIWYELKDNADGSQFGLFDGAGNAKPGLQAAISYATSTPPVTPPYVPPPYVPPPPTNKGCLGLFG